MYVCICMYVYSLGVKVHSVLLNIYSHQMKYIHIYTNTCMYICVSMYIYIYVCMYVYSLQVKIHSLPLICNSLQVNIHSFLLNFTSLLLSFHSLRVKVHSLQANITSLLLNFYSLQVKYIHIYTNTYMYIYISIYIYIYILSCKGPTLSNTRCMCERHGETYECFKCPHVNICMHKMSHEAFHQNHSTGDTDAYSGASAMHACCPTERARKVLPTSQTLNVSLMKVLPSILFGFGVFTCARRRVRCYFACVTACFPPESCLNASPSKSLRGTKSVQKTAKQGKNTLRVVCKILEGVENEQGRVENE